MRPALYAAEHVFPGHPDKLCDAIADALVQEAARREKRALCGVEVAVHRASVFVTGRIACQGAEGIDVEGIVRGVYASAGYGREWTPTPEGLRVVSDLCLGPLNEGEGEFRRVSDDQSILVGYAVDLPGTNYLPPEHWLAFRLGRRLAHLRHEVPGLGLGPDGKVAVVVEEDEAGWRLASFSASVQQKVGGPAIELYRAVREMVRDEMLEASRLLPGLDPQLPEPLRVNGAGDFAVGGPEGDNGLSGKKLVVDAYGPRVPIGGGALSGKDFYKADRAGAVLARRLAKAVVRTGGARACTVTLAFFPGSTHAHVLGLRDEGGNGLEVERWASLLDLSLAGAGDRYAGSADLVAVARHGLFTDPGLPWERLHFDGVAT